MSRADSFAPARVLRKYIRSGRACIYMQKFCAARPAEPQGLCACMRGCEGNYF